MEAKSKALLSSVCFCTGGGDASVLAAWQPAGSLLVEAGLRSNLLALMYRQRTLSWRASYASVPPELKQHAPDGYHKASLLGPQISQRMDCDTQWILNWIVGPRKTYEVLSLQGHD